ncbi:MAG: type II secretion system F family protein [Firmicutes bacterium]|nr:type II secretion system F family protein [Bacillota bacterium]MCL5038833.1 type II secretion system F family protein [Bacillota bacterium]
MKLLILIGVFLTATSSAGILLSTGRERRHLLARRMGELVRALREEVSRPAQDASREDTPGGSSRSDLRSRLATGLEKLVSSRRRPGDRRGLDLALRQAGLRLRAGEFLLLSLLGGLSLLALGSLIGRSLLPRLLLGVGGLFLPYFYLGWRREGRRKLFSGQLPDALDLVANSLRSGYSFLQAVDLVSRELPEPIAEEFGYIIKETRVNIPLEEALANLLEKVDNRDLDLVVTAILIQRQIGGNLAEILEKINGTIRERIRIQGEIRTITAQGRISGLVVALLPAGLAVVLYLLDPGYMGPLFTHPLGKTFLGIGAFMQLIGFLIIRKLVVVDF